jgi:hypothetical protein
VIWLELFKVFLEVILTHMDQVESSHKSPTKGSKSGAKDCLNSLQSKVDQLFKNGNINKNAHTAMTD